MKNIVVIIWILYSIRAYSQAMGFPISFNHNATSTNSFRTSMSQQTLANLSNSLLISRADSIALACGACNADTYFGKGMPQVFNLKSSAHYYNASVDSGKLWIYKMSSPTAIGLQVYFSKFILPPEASFYVYNNDRSIVYGPYTSLNTPEDTTKAVQFGTPILFDNEIYLEYFEPDSSSFVGHIEVNNVIHAFRYLSGQYGTSATCNIDVACEAGWESVSNSVGIITLYDEDRGYVAHCSGTLLNNTNEDGEGYFLTAAHCNPAFLPGPNNITTWDPSTWQIYFDYQQSSCNPAQNYINFHKMLYGADVLSADPINPSNNMPTNSDYLLLKLKEPKESLVSMQLCYSGWESKDISTTINSVDIYSSVHHPRGDYKKITEGDNLRNASSNYGWSPTNFFTFDLTSGTLEGGSSGAGLFRSNSKKLVSTYTGISRFVGFDPCIYNTFYPVFGKFSRHWQLGNFAQYLDPQNQINGTTITSLSGKCFLPVGTNPSYGSGGYTQPNYTYAWIKDGLRVNGQTDMAVLCRNNLNPYYSIAITPLNSNYFYFNTHTREIPCGFLGNNVPPNSECFVQKKVLGIPTQCACRYFSYKITIEELNYDLSGTGNAYSKIQEYGANKTVYAVNVTYLGPDLIQNYTILPGKYYKIFLESAENGNWDYSEIKFFTKPQSLQINNKTITQNVYAEDSIKIVDSYIDSQPVIVAGTEVTIKGETTVKFSHIYNQNIGCDASFRQATINNQANSDEENTSSKDTFSFKGSPKNKVFPNPNNGSFTYQLNKNVGGSIVLRDLLGNEVYRENVFLHEKEKVIDSQNLANGIYILSYYDRTDVLTESQKILFSK